MLNALVLNALVLNAFALNALNLLMQIDVHVTHAHASIMHSLHIFLIFVTLGHVPFPIVITNSPWITNVGGLLAMQEGRVKD